MLEAGQGSDLALEELEVELVGMPACAQDLQCDSAVFVGLRLVHNAHPADTDLPNHPVRPDPRPPAETDDRPPRLKYRVADHGADPLSIRRGRLDERVETCTGSAPQ